MLPLSVVLLQAIPTPGTEGPPPEESMTLFETILQGGWVMIPIGILSVLAIYLFVERMITIRKAAADPESVTARVRDYVQSGDIRGAISFCNQHDRPITRILKRGLERLGRPISEIKDAVEAEGKNEAFKLEKRTDYLASIAGIAPLIGFFGTVLGMISAFQEIQRFQGNVNASVLAGGIWEALLTTAFGLAVGILALFFYNYVLSRIKRQVNDMERTATEFIDLLQEPATK